MHLGFYGSLMFLSAFAQDIKVQFKKAFLRLKWGKSLLGEFDFCVPKRSLNKAPHRWMIFELWLSFKASESPAQNTWLSRK